MPFLSLQHQLLGEKRRFLTERLSLLHQAWEVSGSSGAFDACVRRKEEFVMKRGSLGLVSSKDGPLTLVTRQAFDQNAMTRGRAEAVVEGEAFSLPEVGKTNTITAATAKRGSQSQNLGITKTIRRVLNKICRKHTYPNMWHESSSWTAHSLRAYSLTALTITYINGSLT